MLRKFVFLILAIMVCKSSSLYIPTPCPGRSLISTISALVQLAEGDRGPPRCGCKETFVDVILPPLAAELPCGLGYLPSAAPLVASAYGCGACDSCVPVTSPYSCTALATPLCPELRAFAKPIIL